MDVNSRLNKSSHTTIPRRSKRKTKQPLRYEPTEIPLDDFTDVDETTDRSDDEYDSGNETTIETDWEPETLEDSDWVPFKHGQTSSETNSESEDTDDSEYNSTEQTQNDIRIKNIHPEENKYAPRIQ